MSIIRSPFDCGHMCLEFTPGRNIFKSQALDSDDRLGSRGHTLRFRKLSLESNPGHGMIESHGHMVGG